MRYFQIKNKIINLFKGKDGLCRHCGSLKDTRVVYCNVCIEPQWRMTGPELEDYWSKDKIK